jgi:hypothetical protein
VVEDERETEGPARVHALVEGGIGRGSGVVARVREKGAEAIVGPLRGTVTGVVRVDAQKSTEKKAINE